MSADIPFRTRESFGIRSTGIEPFSCFNDLRDPKKKDLLKEVHALFTPKKSFNLSTV
jgi:hypothetical protein